MNSEEIQQDSSTFYIFAVDNILFSILKMNGYILDVLSRCVYEVVSAKSRGRLLSQCIEILKVSFNICLCVDFTLRIFCNNCDLGRK